MKDLLVVWDERELLLKGIEATVEIVSISAILAFLLGLFLFGILILKIRYVSPAVKVMIDLMRAVPFMLLCYLIYYGLPSVGLVMGNIEAGILALTIYNAAYVAELLRGTWAAFPPETIEAGQAFGFYGWRLVARIIAPPVILDSIPMLGNQMIQVIKDSAFLMIIAVQELTYAANEIQATYYVPFASLLAAVLFYWLLCLAVEQAVGGMLRVAERRR